MNSYYCLVVIKILFPDISRYYNKIFVVVIVH